MHRDIDLIREILIEVEKKDDPRGWMDLHIENYTDLQIYYHVKLLAEAGYLEVRELSTCDGFVWKPISLTWQGHDFLDAARNDTRWKKAKKFLNEKVTSVPFEVLKTFLVHLAEAELGL